MRNSPILPFFFIVSSLFLPTLRAQSPLRYPDPGANRIRVEVHLLPAVTTGPLDPAWSPDGKWLAFSMEGDIWKVPAAGGTALALTAGPGYHFEPVWSPDGRTLALTVDRGGNLEVAVVSADGGPIRLVTADPNLDIQPAWASSGEGLYFVSARAGSFDILYAELRSGRVTPVVTGRGHQIQPAISPRGDLLAYVSPARGRLGSGGIWTKTLPDGEPHLVHYEETSYRAKPSWTSDETALLFISDQGGSNDVAVIPAKGGSRARLTEDPMDEYGAVSSPDGSSIAFVSNFDGPTRLFTMPAGGARRKGWHEVTLTARHPRKPTGRLKVNVFGPEGKPSPARVYLEASDGRTYAPRGGFHRVISATETHYFYTGGSFEVEVPSGEVKIEAMRGFEYQPASASIEVIAGQSSETVLQLGRLIDAPKLGWYSGETHTHDLHQGRFGLSYRNLFDALLGEDLHVTNALIHMDGTKLMGRWEDLTGKPHPLSTPNHILQYGQEFRGSFGHVGLLGIKEFIMPLIGGTRGTVFAADVLNFPYLDAARAQGGIGGFMHPYTRPVRQPRDGAGSEIALDVALGKGDFYDVLCIWYDELGNAEMYYRYLNAGFRLAATGGSDNFSDAWRDPPPGTSRTYARLTHPLSAPSWLDAVKSGRTFGTSGPLLFLKVNGRDPGEEIRLASGDLSPVTAAVEVATIVPLNRVEIVMNGRVVKSVDVTSRGRRFSLSIPVKIEGKGGWVAARALGPSSRYVGDSYAFVQTSPVYILRGGKRFTSAADARFLARMVDALWKRVEARNRWRTPSEKEVYRQAVEKARHIYEEIAESAERRQP